MDRRVGHGRYQECRTEEVLRVPLFPAGSDTDACMARARSPVSIRSVQD
jgi:hypothetical protein